ncbi:flavin reductase [Lutimonas saemankumensis]|uniref:flavin reductase family protein n=1 Tax=Lutimonas saemankumensis TaxID=483016 RepID=UPI001CD53BA0|nr:flavin reductase [Lutimonas saemankumensis]MCA0931940.1 flavin reductase [Lutimonas saemankumensis]
MRSFTKYDLKEMERLYKINLINSASGFKSANLIGSISKSGNGNVAIFSSVIHLGSDPALLGFVSRPVSVRRNTYDNIKETGVYTINHIYEDIIEDAHHTSAKYDASISEFTMTDLSEEFKSGCQAPFVKGAPVQMKMKFLEEVKLNLNGTLMIIGEIQELFVDQDILKDDGLINLTEAKVVALNGLDHYTIPQSEKRLPYQRPKISNQLIKET